MRKIKTISAILALCAIFSFAAPTASAITSPDVTAQAILLADRASGNVLYAKNVDEKRSPASLTKIMTGLLAVEAVESNKIRMDDVIVAPDNCRYGLDEESSTAGIQPGEQMTFGDVLYCAMVSSANEACNIIAVTLSGSIEAFVGEMNEKALALGATHTRFADPNGLTSDTALHYTTAYDLYLISTEAMRHPLFVTLCDTAHYEVPATNMSDIRTLSSSNALICTDGYYGPNYMYDGAHGIKTGYTKAAGYCLVSTAIKSDVNLICIIMGCNGWLNTGDADYGNFSGTITLYKWAFENFSYRSILTAGENVAERPVEHTPEGTRVTLRPAENVRLLVPNDTTDADITVDLEISEEKLVAPIAPKTVLGTATVYVKGEKKSSVDLVTMDSIEADRHTLFKEKLHAFFSAGWLKTLLIIILVAAALYVALKIRYISVKRRHMRQRQEAAERRRLAQEKQQQQAAREAQRWRSEENHHVVSVNKPKVDGTGITTLSPAARELDQIELDALIKSLGLDKDN